MKKEGNKEGLAPPVEASERGPSNKVVGYRGRSASAGCGRCAGNTYNGLIHVFGVLDTDAMDAPNGGWVEGGTGGWGWRREHIIYGVAEFSEFPPSLPPPDVV